MDKIIYERKGLPKKMKTFLTIAIAFTWILGIIILIFAFTAKTYTGWEGYSTGNIMYVSNSGGISDNQKRFLYILGFLSLLVGGFCFTALRNTKNNYIKLYGTYMEGSGGFWVISKAFRVEYNRIQEIVSNPNGLLPSVHLRTKDTQNYFVFTDEPKEIEEILYQMIKKRGN